MDDGRVPSEPGSREPSPSGSVSAASGFDPSRVRRPGLATRLHEFELALFDIRWVTDRVMGGQQFNAYESAENDEYDDPDDWEYKLCLGPITDARFICPIVGRDRALLVEAAMKVATEAMLERRARDSDGSRNGRDAGERLDPKDDSAGPQDIATPQSDISNVQ